MIFASEAAGAYVAWEVRSGRLLVSPALLHGSWMREEAGWLMQALGGSVWGPMIHGIKQQVLMGSRRIQALLCMQFALPYYHQTRTGMADPCKEHRMYSHMESCVHVWLHHVCSCAVQLNA